MITLPAVQTAFFLEYDWSFDCYRPRFGSTFTSFRGEHSFPSLAAAKAALAHAGMRLGRKTGSRTWQIAMADSAIAIV